MTQEDQPNQNTTENTSTGRTLRPKCIDPGIVPAYVSTGHILPCCYIDGVHDRDSMIESLFADHLKIESNDNVLQIFASDEWVEFFSMLMDRPEQAPKKCWAHCGRINMNDTVAMMNKKIIHDPEG